MKKHHLLIGLILLLIFPSVIPISIGQDVKILDNKEQSSNRGTILYVGGSGPNNYTRIHQAIHYAMDGDTVFVYNYSSPYYETFDIDRLITLIGEDKNDTIIIGGSLFEPVIAIKADGVIINGFKIQDNDQYFGINIFSNNVLIINNIIADSITGIGVHGNNNTIFNNIIENNSDFGIRTYNNNVEVKDNIIRDNHYGIFGSKYNTNICGNYIENNYIGICPDALSLPICNNIFVNNEYGINTDSCYGINVTTNSFQNNNYGVFVDSNSKGNNIIGNNFRNNNYGVYLENKGNKITNNNFIDNKNDAAFNYQFFSTISEKNYWQYNYWNRPRFLPKCINGILTFHWLGYEDYTYPWVNFDWHPAKEPYDIGL